MAADLLVPDWFSEAGLGLQLGSLLEAHCIGSPDYKENLIYLLGQQCPRPFLGAFELESAQIFSYTSSS